MLILFRFIVPNSFRFRNAFTNVITISILSLHFVKYFYTFLENAVKSMLSAGNKLRNLIKGAGYTQETAAEMLGITRQTLSNYLKMAEMPADFLQNVITKLGIDIGDIQNEVKDNKIARFQQLKEANRPMTEGDFIRMRKAIGDKESKGIIYVPIPAQAGYAKNFLEEVYVHQLRRYPIALPYEGENFRVFQVKGDSMEYIDKVTGRPDGLFEGMDVVAEIVQPDDWKRMQIPPYHVYVIVTVDQILIKRLLIKDKDNYVMHSDNPDTKPQQELLPKQNIKELWYVKRKIDWDMAPPERIDIQI